MDEAGRESGVLMCFQQLVKAGWMEKTDEGQRKMKERKETRLRNPLTRCMEEGVRDHMCWNKNLNS